MRVEPVSLAMVDHLSLKVRPERLDLADPAALAVNGYDAALWGDAVSLELALAKLSELLRGAVLAGHNVGFDWSFLCRAFNRVDLPLPELDYHRLDTASLAWLLVACGESRSVSLDAVTQALGLARPRPHRALDDALAALAVARKLRDRIALGHSWTEVQA